MPQFVGSWQQPVPTCICRERKSSNIPSTRLRHKRGQMLVTKMVIHFYLLLRKRARRRDKKVEKIKGLQKANDSHYHGSELSHRPFLPGGESSVRLAVPSVIDRLSGALRQQWSWPFIFSCISYWWLGNAETSRSLTLLYTAFLRIRGMDQLVKSHFHFIAFHCLFAKNKICYMCSVLWQKSTKVSLLQKDFWKVQNQW